MTGAEIKAEVEAIYGELGELKLTPLGSVAERVTGLSERMGRVLKAWDEAAAKRQVRPENAEEFNAEPAETFREPPPAPREFKTTPLSDIRDPLAKSLQDLVTPKQLGMIRAISREAGLDADEECQSVLRCKTDELSKRAASSFIDHLKEAQTQFSQPQTARGRT